MSLPTVPRHVEGQLMSALNPACVRVRVCVCARVRVHSTLNLEEPMLSGESIHEKTPECTADWV